jgi:SAM-dependent methyltransferase
MLARAVSAEAADNVGFLRADAQALPFRDETFDAATSLAVLQLIPEPTTTLAEIARVLKPGGRVAIMVPTVGRGAGFLRLLPNGGVNFFDEDELGDAFEELGFVGVRTKTIGNIGWVRARKP